MLSWVERRMACFGIVKYQTVHCELTPSSRLKCMFHPTLLPPFQALILQGRYHIDVNTSGSHALIAQAGGRVHLVGIRQDDNKGKIEQGYALKESDGLQDVNYNSGVTFTSKCQMLVFGCTDGCSLVWSKDKAEVVYGLDHGEGEVSYHRPNGSLKE